MPPLATLQVGKTRVLGGTIVPNDNSTLLPFHANMEVSAVREVVVQELQDRVGLFFLKTYDIASD
jgi:hypothetical protein